MEFFTIGTMIWSTFIEFLFHKWRYVSFVVILIHGLSSQFWQILSGRMPQMEQELLSSPSSICNIYIYIYISNLVSSTNENDHHYMTEILLKVALSTINHNMTGYDWCGWNYLPFWSIWVPLVFLWGLCVFCVMFVLLFLSFENCIFCSSSNYDC